MSHHYNHKHLNKELRSSRSNESHSPRPTGHSPSHRSRTSSGSRSLSRSRSPPVCRRSRIYISRSRSRSPDRRNFHRPQRSPVSHRNSPIHNSSSGGENQSNRENPPPSRCLGVFGLSASVKEADIYKQFGRYGRIESVKIVYDVQTGNSRGFGFVYFEEESDAAQAKERCNGLNLDGRDIRVDFSVTQRAHSPTPGIYMGKVIRRRGGRNVYIRSRDGRRYDNRRSPGGSSSSGRRNGAMRYTRSRSRSPLPQRHYR